MATLTEVFETAQYFYALENPHSQPPFDVHMVSEFLSDYDPAEMTTAEDVDNFCQDFLATLVDDPAEEQRVYY